MSIKQFSFDLFRIGKNFWKPEGTCLTNYVKWVTPLSTAWFNGPNDFHFTKKCQWRFIPESWLTSGMSSSSSRPLPGKPCTLQAPQPTSPWRRRPWRISRFCRDVFKPWWVGPWPLSNSVKTWDKWWRDLRTSRGPSDDSGFGLRSMLLSKSLPCYRIQVRGVSGTICSKMVDGINLKTIIQDICHIFRHQVKWSCSHTRKIY